MPETVSPFLPAPLPLGATGADGARRGLLGGSWPWPRSQRVGWVLVVALGGAVALPAIVAYRVVSPQRLLLMLMALTLATVACRVALGVRGNPPPTVWGWCAVAIAALASWPVAVLDSRPAAWVVFVAALSLSNAMLLLAPTALRRAELGRRRHAGRVFFVGCSADREALAGEMRQRKSFSLVGVADIRDGMLLDAGALFAAISATEPSVLVLSEEALRDEQWVGIASALNLAGVRVRDLRAFFEQEFRKVAVSNLTVSWFLFDIAEVHHRKLYGWVKRVFETAGSACLLLLSAPTFPLIVLAIKLQSPGPVFFRQPRVGKSGQVFSLTKFRTMHSDAEHEHGEWASDAPLRIFRAGRFLRKFRLDELPQLWNVVRGELSLVGPRPEQPAIVARLEKDMPFYAARHCVRPGLTGWAQVNYGYGGSDEGALVKLQYDLYYLKRQSLGLDLRIIASTVRTILWGTGS